MLCDFPVLRLVRSFRHRDRRTEIGKLSPYGDLPGLLATLAMAIGMVIILQFRIIDECLFRIAISTGRREHTY
jgi:hypothetical protein